MKNLAFFLKKDSLGNLSYFGFPHPNSKLDFLHRSINFYSIINALKIPSGQNRDGSDSYFQFPYFFYDYQIKINLDINQDHRITYSRFYGDDVLDYTYDDSETIINQDVERKYDSGISIKWPWGNRTNGLIWRWIVSPELVTKTFISNSRYRFDFDLGFFSRDTYTYTDSVTSIFTDVNWRLYDIINDNSVDYPDFAKKVSNRVRSRKSDIGILICGSGTGMAISANKSKGIRAALCYNLKSARLSRQHNNANIMCLGSRFTSKNSALRLVSTFLKTKFEGGRHLRRIKKI